MNTRRKNGGLSIPSITTSSWFSASPPPPIPPIPGKIPWLTMLPILCTKFGYGEVRSGARCSNIQSRHAAFSMITSPLGLIAAQRPVVGAAVHVMFTRHGAGPCDGVPPAERVAAHADGVDLVDEDDALAAPLARELLGLAGEEADDDRVDADERLGEARARDRDERRVEAGRDRLGDHRLARSRRSEEEQASLALAAGALEHLAGLPERDDAADLLLGLGLAPDVVELDAPFGVAGLVAADLRDAHQEQRAHEDQEVETKRPKTESTCTKAVGCARSCVSLCQISRRVFRATRCRAEDEPDELVHVDD